MGIRRQIELVIKEVEQRGVKVGNTKEVINTSLTQELKSMDWEKERDDIRQLLSTHGLSLEEKYREEEYHYAFLEYGLLQKMRAVKYFHDQGLDSRKIVLFSEDCISLIQWITRHERSTNFMNVYVRSSDAFGLLATDILYLCKLGLRVVEEYPEIASYLTRLSVNVASCHIYIDEEGNPTTRDGVKINV